MRTRVVLASVAYMAAALATSAYSAEAATSKPRLYTLHFVEANVPSVAEYVASATGKTIIVDYRIKDPITLETKDPVTADEFYEAFVRVLTDKGLNVTVGRDGVVQISTRKKIPPSTDRGGFITI